MAPPRLLGLASAPADDLDSSNLLPPSPEIPDAAAAYEPWELDLDDDDGFDAAAGASWCSDLAS